MWLYTQGFTHSLIHKYPEMRGDVIVLRKTLDVLRETSYVRRDTYDVIRRTSNGLRYTNTSSLTRNM
jgi:ribosomal protein L19E